MIAGDAVDALRRGRHAADDVPASDDDGGLDPELVDFADLVGDAGDDVRVDAEGALAHERLARKLEENSAVDGSRRHWSDYLRVGTPDPRSDPIV